MNQNQNLQTNHAGMVAITVTMILMVVISLIVIGFSTTIRREQRQALDAQLSSQAFCAAESGVNLAVKKLQEEPKTEKNQCRANEGFPPVFGAGDYDLGGGVEITCLLINPNVSSIVHQNLGMNSKVSRISAAQPIDRIHITWKAGSPANGNGCSGVTTFPTKNGWSPCDQPLLRVDLVGLKNPNSLDAADLKASQFTAFLSPRSGSFTPTYNYVDAQGAGQGQVFAGSCVNDANDECFVDIMTPSGGGAGAIFGSRKDFAIRVMSLYRDSSEVKIQVFHGSDTDPQRLQGSQALIDVTAKAQDVLKRVQARVNLAGFGSGYVPDFAIDSRSGICKRYTTNGVTPVVATGLPPECQAP